MGGGNTKAPKPSKLEKALMQAQLDTLNQSRAESDAMKPFLLKSLGLAQTTDANGNISYRQLTTDEQLAGMSPLERSNYDIARMQQDRMKLALEGKLPVSPALEEEIANQEKTMREGLSRKLGSDYENSTAGIQAMNEFNNKSGLLREESRRGEISSGEGVLLSQQGYMSGLNQANQQNMSNYDNRLFPLVQSYGSAQQPYQFNRSLQMQANQINSQSDAGMWGGLGSLAGAGLNYGMYKKWI